MRATYVGSKHALTGFFGSLRTEVNILSKKKKKNSLKKIYIILIEIKISIFLRLTYLYTFRKIKSIKFLKNKIFLIKKLFSKKKK
jgi:hypothetical protein